MTLQLYSGPLSLFTAKVRIALDEKSLAYERIEVGWSLADRYLPHHPEVARLNPKAQVPILVDGDVVVYDSTQIFEYLEDAYPAPLLYPSTARGRARCRRYEAWADEVVFPFVWDLIEESFYPAGQGESGRLARAKAGLGGLHRELDAELASRATICDAYSVADIAAFVFLSTAALLGAPIADSCEHLQAWQARIAARPAVKREIEALMQASVAARSAV